MKPKILLITPPFTQLNTPYPATAYLKGFLNTQQIDSFQCDLGIEAILEIFSKQGLSKLFELAIESKQELSMNAQRMIALKKQYISTINDVIAYLQNKKPSIAHLICNDEFLPEASRFEQVEDTESLFGVLGINDKARYLSTLYLEDISDLIIETIDPDFGFSRYAEHIGISANTFDSIYEKLNEPLGWLDKILIELLEQKITNYQPTVVGLSIPFPGNLLGGLRCGQFLKQKYPNIKVVLGGGFINTELRSLSEKRIFEFTDFITLDDGEMPIIQLISYLQSKIDSSELVRTFLIENNELVYRNNLQKQNYKQAVVGTPDYTDFQLTNFLSVIEIANPMHRLWNDGRWNKLTFAHGCYWAQCNFCDTSLDYIKRYDPNSASILCDRVEEIITQTGENGFHFVDEAAPPSLMRAFALEIIRRELNIVWWTNVRFERNFTADLCLLLKHSGCIAVSGGLEVASDRILKNINKGVDIEQVAKVTHNFTTAGIMVHAYLMYGFPTQTVQETIDSLEVVRQLFAVGIVQSAYWHKFTMTAHSPIGLNPTAFGVSALKTEISSFANNDIPHDDPTGCKHDLYAEGLRKALFNYMHGLGFEFPLADWFNLAVPKTSISPKRIEKAIQVQTTETDKSKRFVWIGNKPITREYSKTKKGKKIQMLELIIRNRKEDIVLNINLRFGLFVNDLLEKCSISNEKYPSYSEIEQPFEVAGLGDFSVFEQGQSFSRLKEVGLLLL